jgi:hypothetical protein
MSYASMAALGQDPEFQTRVKVAAYIDCQQNLDNPDRADWSNLAYDILRGADTALDSFVRFVAQTPSIADTAGDPPDQSKITDDELAVAVNECYPVVASLWYNPDGSGWTGALYPPVEPVEPSVTGVSPASGPFHATTDVTIAGTGLTGTTLVNIGEDCLNLNVFDDATVSATVVDSLGKGVYPVLVTVDGNVITGPDFEVA